MGTGSRRLTPSLIWQAILYRLDRRRLKRRFVRPPTVGRSDLVAGLRALGMGDGDDVMFHSSLSSLGDIEGGADTVIDAFLEVVGREGTVLAPSFSRFELRKGVFGSWWDPATTPVYTGIVTETF